jgi:hypothetical protein
VLFLVASLIYVVLMRLGILYAVDFFDAGVFILVTNFILLPYECLRRGRRMGTNPI